MPPRETATITSTRNPRIVEARKLAQRKHRERQGRFLVEGLQLIGMALAAGYRPLEVFYAPEMASSAAAQAVLEQLGALDVPRTPVAPHVMEALAERELSQGLVAIFRLWATDLASLPVGAGSLVLVLDRLQDPGNLGTLVRTADAVGAAAVVLLEPAVDPFHPKAVRATMGSLFHVPIARTADAAGALAALRAAGLRTVAADPYRGVPWGEGLLDGGVALVMGSEAHGLSEDLRAAVEGWAILPMVGRAESLNVAEAGSVLMYFWLHANSAPPQD